MQNELLYKAQKSSVENTQKVDERGLGHERKMTLVLVRMGGGKIELYVYRKDYLALRVALMVLPCVTT